MITLNVGFDNPFTPDFYNNLITSLQFHRLRCTCGHSGCLSVHGYYTRYLKLPEGRTAFRICRVVCSCCGRTHALLPSFIVPYSQTLLTDQLRIIRLFGSGSSLNTVMSDNPSLDESSCRYIIRQYLRCWKQKILSECIPLSDPAVLISRCFSAFSRQFMQIHCTPNILFSNTT